MITVSTLAFSNNFICSLGFNDGTMTSYATKSTSLNLAGSIFFWLTIPDTKFLEFENSSLYLVTNVLFFMINSPRIVIFGVAGKRRYGIKCEMSCPTDPLPRVYSFFSPFSVEYIALIPSNFADRTYGPEYFTFHFGKTVVSGLILSMEGIL